MGVIPRSQTREAHKHIQKEQAEASALQDVASSTPHSMSQSNNQTKEDQTTIYTCADKFQTHTSSCSCIKVSSSFLSSAALNLAPTHLFDLLKSFLRTSPFFLSPFPSFCVRHKKVSHSDGAVGSVRWFRGKGSWQTDSFLTARADIISRVLDWIPKKKTIASSCPLHYYYSSHCLQKGLKHVIVKRRGFECYLQSSPCLSLFIWFP